MGEFARQILPSVIDKVLLGGIVVVFGYWLNRRIERFRSGLARHTEYAREQTRRLDELYTLMLDVERAANYYAGQAGTHIEWAKSNRVGGGPALGDPEPEVHGYEKFQELSHSLKRLAANYRPWIGDELAANCAEYERRVDQIVVEGTVAGSHDIFLIEKLEARTKDLQEAIVRAIRPPAQLK